MEIEKTIRLFDIVTITPEAFYYKDEQIDDSGKIYKLLSKVLSEGVCNVKWISSKEMLPESGQSVVYYFEPIGTHIGKFVKVEHEETAVVSDCFWSTAGWLCDEDVWWFPIPSSPEPESEK